MGAIVMERLDAALFHGVLQRVDLAALIEGTVGTVSNPSHEVRRHARFRVALPWCTIE